MFRPVISIALTLLLAICPLMCRVIPVCSHDGDRNTETAVTTACDHCCHEDGHRDADESEPGPPPTCPCRSKCYDCICCGAIVQKGIDYTSLLLPSLDVMVDFAPVLPAAAHGLLERVPSDGPSPLSGRDLRTLISSFLC